MQTPGRAARRWATGTQKSLACSKGYAPHPVTFLL
jgi:hypothetical protein